MRALDVGAAWAAAAAGPSVQLEARVDGCRPVLWGGRRRVTALLPPPARQLRHRHPDRGARRVAALPRRAEGDAVVGWPARPPQQGHAGVHRQPAPLAGGGAAARLRAGTEPGGGAVEQSQGQGRRACQPHRPDAGGGDRPSPAWHPAGPSDPVPGVLVPASNRPIGLLDLVTVSTQLPRPVNHWWSGRAPYGLLLAFRSLAWPSTALGRSSRSSDLGRLPRGCRARRRGRAKQGWNRRRRLGFHHPALLVGAAVP